MSDNRTDNVGRIFDAHARALVLYARQWLDDGGARNAVQEAFVRSLRCEDLPPNMLPWLYRTVRSIGGDRQATERPASAAARAESQARKNVGILFDDHRLNDETSRLLHKLSDMQQDNGAWPWFPGGRTNDYITLYITTGFGRLRHLGVEIDTAPAVKSLARLDIWIDETYRKIIKSGNKDDNHLTSTIALYLYGRSFFLEDKAIDAKHKEAVDYFLGGGYGQSDVTRRHAAEAEKGSVRQTAYGRRCRAGEG